MTIGNNPKTRRQFLKTSATVAASALVSYNVQATLRDPLAPLSLTKDDVPESDKFPLGVACGDVTSSQALLWTCYEGIYPLKLALWHHKDLTKPILLINVARADGGFVHVDLNGLEANQRYQYAFIELNFNAKPVFRSRLGFFRVAPNANDLVPLQIGAVCCTYNSFEPTILEHAGERQDLDFFLLLGDTSYNDGAETLDEFRGKWAQNLSKDGYLALRSATSVTATLDDHEVENNFNPETIEPDRLQAAKRAFFENQPIRRSQEQPDRIWRKFRWGRTLEVFVLDCRTERKPSTRNQKNAQYISRAQMNWLKDSLSQSEAAFKIIMNSVPISTFPFFSESDRWEGYPNQREEILNFIDQEKISGILWVAGDFHFASIGKVDKEGPGKKQQEILVGPGAQFPNYLCLPLNLSSQFEWASARNNYVTLNFDPYKMNIELVYHGGAEDPRLTRRGEITEIYRTKIHLGKQ